MFLCNFLFACLALIAGFICYVLFGKERTVYQSVNGLSWPYLIVKFMKKLFQHRHQGELKLDNTLVYVADVGNEDFPLMLSVRNHRIIVKGIRIQEKDVGEYKTLCGYKYTDTVPVCFADVLFIKPVIALITSTKFCLSPLGLIHIRQVLKQSVSLEEYINADLTAELAVKQYRQNERGVEVDIAIRLLDSRDVCVWEGTKTLFSRKATKPGNKPVKQDKEKYQFSQILKVPGNTGVKYARLSNDWNPFHLYWWTSFFLGFSKPIAHGMWTISRALAIVQNEADTPFDGRHEITCAFKKPLLMPGTVSVKYNHPEEALYKECKIRVEDAKTGVPHLLATIKTL